MILFVISLPFALYGIGCSFYYLGRFLVRQAPGLWAKLWQKGRDRR